MDFSELQCLLPSIKALSPAEKKVLMYWLEKELALVEPKTPDRMGMGAALDDWAKKVAQRLDGGPTTGFKQVIDSLSRNHRS